MVMVNQGIDIHYESAVDSQLNSLPGQIAPDIIVLLHISAKQCQKVAISYMYRPNARAWWIIPT